MSELPSAKGNTIASRHSAVCVSKFSSVQSLSRVWLFATPWTAAHQTSLSITVSWSLPKLMSIESVMPSSHLILCHPLLLLPSIFPSIRVFSNESGLCIKWPKYWSFRFNISLSTKHPGLISFRMDWLDLLAVQGTLKSLLQHHSSKASILLHSAFFIVQLTTRTRLQRQVLEVRSWAQHISRYRIEWDWASLLVDSIELMGTAKRSYWHQSLDKSWLLHNLQTHGL